MAWFKVDEHFSSHPATSKAGDSALGLWLRLGCWLATYPKQGDFIPLSSARHFGTKTQLIRLIDAELLLVVDGGYRLNRSMAIATSGLSGPSWDIESALSRRAIQPWLRAAVYDRDDRKCVECGSTEYLSLDHIYPFSLGGEDTLENLQTLCRPCNSRKGARV